MKFHSRIGTSLKSGARHSTSLIRRSGAGAGAAFKTAFRHQRYRDLPILPRRGALELRLARNAAEVAACQSLRYRVFYEEMSAVPNSMTSLTKRDMDRFDRICDHLMVIDHSLHTKSVRNRRLVPLRRDVGSVVGTYRLLHHDVAAAHGGFYTTDEYDLEPLIEWVRGRHRFLELGRSCVLPEYRNKPTLELLWQGIMAYLAHYELDVMVGCASLPGTNPDKLALPLSYLHHYHSVPEDWPDPWHVRAVPRRYVSMNRMPKGEINVRAALRALPPLIKGYVRAGAHIGDGAVVDYQFGTTDVLIIFPVWSINDRYYSRFSVERSMSALSVVPQVS